jgi:hypothetical protein
VTVNDNQAQLLTENDNIMVIRVKVENGGKLSELHEPATFRCISGFTTKSMIMRGVSRRARYLELGDRQPKE